VSFRLEPINEGVGASFNWRLKILMAKLLKTNIKKHLVVFLHE